ncbi:MAG: helicase C-terminal domain-containing protein [Nanoarchaeota archaeon]
MEKEGSLLDFDVSGRVIVPEGNESNRKELKTSESLAFLKEEKYMGEGKIEKIFDDSSWALYENGKKLDPLLFSNGKKQDDVVKEVVDLIRGGKKIVFIHGVCGTGKSAIALHIARELGRASIVVPVKGLQRQYEEDYMGKKQVLKKNGEKMKIAMITGRDNHDSVIFQGKSCADFNLPDNIKIIDKNMKLLEDYYLENPLNQGRNMPNITKLKRIHIAPANPHWSPILPANYEAPLKDAKKRRYMGLQGKEFIFYHRKPGCSYFDQYLAYLDSDVIIFNSAKYKIEVALDRKPETEVDVVDECDEFLDNFSAQEELNLTKLGVALKGIVPENEFSLEILDKISELIELEHRNKKALGINENKIFHISETNVQKILNLIFRDETLQAEIELDEMNYANKALEVIEQFKEMFDDIHLTFKYREGDLVCNLVSTNLSKRFSDIVSKNKALVLMSGTLHSKEVLEKVFGIKDFALVDAETSLQGNLEIIKTGKEIDCRYSNFVSGKNKREDYLEALRECMRKAEKPVLIHVNAFDDLPNMGEKDYEENGLISKETLYALQESDRTGRMISMFKSGLSDMLFSTRCARGVDFPGKQCNSIVFTKYPNPNVQDIFWKVLQKMNPAGYWSFYKDKARREFLQRVYRGLRSKEDHVYILSPDTRVLDAVKEMQK